MSEEQPRTAPEPRTAEQLSDRVGLDRPGVAMTAGGRPVEAPAGAAAPRVSESYDVFVVGLVLAVQALLLAASSEWLALAFALVAIAGLARVAHSRKGTAR